MPLYSQTLAHLSHELADNAKNEYGQHDTFPKNSPDLQLLMPFGLAYTGRRGANELTGISYFRITKAL